MKRDTLRKLVHIILRVIARVEFVGAENIPPSGGVILATNHMSRIDTPLLFVNPVRPDITALVTDKYKAYPFFRWFTTTAEGIWIDREIADFTAFRLAIEAIQSGKALGIAPEGTRSTTASLQEAKVGTALLAVRAGVAVVPVAIEGTETAVAQFKRLRRPRVVIHFGKPLPPPVLTRENRNEAMQCFTDEIMCQMAAMLPPPYRGFYAQHPRLKEILGE